MAKDSGKESQLTPKQQRFVQEYMIDSNATQAAIRAGYSEKTAQEQSSRLLSNVKVAKAIEDRLQKLSKKTLITAERVIEGLLTEAEYYGESSSHGARVSAWEKLGKHLGIFVEKVEHKHDYSFDMNYGKGN